MVVSVENPLLSGGKVIVLAAATGNQISSDYAKKEHGLFTLNLLRGLSLTGIGSADRNRDGFITLRELFPYVREKVASMAVEELDREQTPILLPGEDSLGERMDLKLAKAVTSLLELAFPEFNEEEKARKKTRARPFEAPRQTGREITGKDGAPMLLVPEGEFLYGDYKQRLSLPAFYMDKYEVTTKLYAAFLQGTSREKPRFWDDVSLASDGDRPVVGVTWSDADAYCRYYGKRLPTEQEWEKAARGTDGRKYPWGNKEPTGRHAKYDHDGKASWHGYATLVSVESYEAGKSPYGLYHMAGNVWEWTSSDYDSSSKVIRGGSWLADASDLWSANRVMWPPDFWTTDRGFRCVQDAPK
jgi:formylglycine-generating enzyme required for sulfatase activity